MRRSPRDRGGRGGEPLRGRGGCGLRDAVAALHQPVAYSGLRWAGAAARGEGVVGLDLVAVLAKVVHGLAGTADAVLLGVGEPVQARGVGDGLELFTDQEPVG